MSVVYNILLDNGEKTVATYSNEKLSCGDKVAVNIPELDDQFAGTVTSLFNVDDEIDTSAYASVVGLLSEADLKRISHLKEEERELVSSVQEIAKSLGLEMSVFQVSLSLTRGHCRVYYTADSRVDYREFVRQFSRVVRSRIDMHQVGARDRARLVGGIGTCGLKLCCASFLNSFDGIGIQMAKNQLLAINIPKLSGQCGKLICCLKYEDGAYSASRPLFPKIGTEVTYEGNLMKVDSINILSSTVHLRSEEKSVTLSLDDFNRVKKGLALNEKKSDIDAELDNLSKAISSTFGSETVLDKKKDINKQQENRNNSKRDNNYYKNQKNNKYRQNKKYHYHNNNNKKGA